MATVVELEQMIVRLVGDGSSYQKMLADAQAQTRVAASKIEGFSKQIEGFGSSMAGFAGAALAQIGALVGGVTLLGNVFKGVGLAAEAEKNEIAFGTMLQSAEKGKQMVADLQKFAAETPLNTADVQSATRLLLQFGTAGEDIIPTLRMLGDATGGDAERLRLMSLAFGQASSTGRLMGEDLNQMINAGFNPLQQMAENMAKKSGGQAADYLPGLKKDMELSKISIDMVKEAFKSATGEGGRFFGGMEKASKGLLGLFSTMQDDTDAMRREFGKLVIDMLRLKDVVRWISQDAQAFTKWFGSLSYPVKQASLGLGALAIVVGGLSLAWPILAGGVGLFVTAGYRVVAVGRGIVSVLSAVRAISISEFFVSATRSMMGYTVVTDGATRATTALKIAQAGLIIALVAAAGALVFALAGGFQAQKELNSATEEGIRLNQQLAKMQDERGAKTLNVSEGSRESLASSIKQAETEVQGLELRLRSVNKELEEMDTTGEFLARNIPLAGSGKMAEFEAQRQAVKEAQENLARKQEEIKKLRELAAKTKDPATDPAILKSIKDLTHHYELQNSTLLMTKEEAELYKAGLSKLPDVMIRNIIALQQMNKELEKEKKLRDAAKETIDRAIDSQKDLIDNLKMEAETYGLNATEAKIYENQRKGATDEDTAAAYALSDAKKAREALSESMKEGLALTKEFRTPMQVYTERMTELDNLLKLGAVGLDVYDRAAKGAADSLKDATDKTKGLNSELNKVNAVSTDSAEGLARVSDYLERSRGASSSSALAQSNLRQAMGRGAGLGKDFAGMNPVGPEKYTLEPFAGGEPSKGGFYPSPTTPRGIAPVGPKFGVVGATSGEKGGGSPYDVAPGIGGGAVAILGAILLVLQEQQKKANATGAVISGAALAAG